MKLIDTLPEEFCFLSESERDTEALGYAVASLFSEGGVIALRGDLASGKTCFVRGMARKLAADYSVCSPTFTLVNEYGKDPSGKVPRLIHVDLYRLVQVEELYDLPLEEIFDGTVVCAVEWAERAEAILPSGRLDVFFEHIIGEQRRVRMVNRACLQKGWQQTLSEHLQRAANFL
ncbi:MAG TPA: tRNA (adenosine(37)-N6)-threonylcarbamoyltransferase complex ATPase subunit type 1 TsaE [Candidatus Hydrogenedentes bacterium]|nr:tRNA (adenosine(37)-N6)-threonylcarbamoyltransferase complex ATPase subunit type 1 TsaE [Candidatus Hydrogenedentota bacterium]HOL77806.1 tRNA (adenosine(37)-N6)-threonylcarbamoyltransferase complex ATPase subunit type 1 TsaE [Candidatus Hydrogenedentota bacterium]HPO86868.1 tRNA (adenosine(37)-N6)-threonylcarbamoyltransferase complex ATPase subunit type 1 TsaE [Candidatus Hydrogenedentota bacterium]